MLTAFGKVIGGPLPVFVTQNTVAIKVVLAHHLGQLGKEVFLFEGVFCGSGLRGVGALHDQRFLFTGISMVRL